jgi:hypothetical protein
MYSIEINDIVANMGSAISALAVISVIYAYHDQEFSKNYALLEKHKTEISSAIDSYTHDNCADKETRLCDHLYKLRFSLFTLCGLGGGFDADETHYWESISSDRQYQSPMMANWGRVQVVSYIDGRLKLISAICGRFSSLERADNSLHYLQRPSYKLALGLVLFMFVITKITISLKKGYSSYSRR